MTHSWGGGGRGDTNTLVSRGHNRQAEGTQAVAVEASRKAALDTGPAGDSLIKLPFSNVLKGEGEELEPGPGVEFVLEFHPGKKRSKAVISQGK